jgi:uncharacterized protein (DUF433 family)
VQAESPEIDSRGKIMQLEDYFEILEPDDIRVKGTRIGIETVLYEYLHGSRSPEEIAARYPALSLEQVYATITWYLHNQDATNAYLGRWLEGARRVRDEQAKHPSAGLEKLRRLKAERRQSAGSAVESQTS